MEVPRKSSNIDKIVNGKTKHFEHPNFGKPLFLKISSLYPILWGRFERWNPHVGIDVKKDKADLTNTRHSSCINPRFEFIFHGKSQGYLFQIWCLLSHLIMVWVRPTQGSKCSIVAPVHSVVDIYTIVCRHRSSLIYNQIISYDLTYNIDIGTCT